MPNQTMPPISNPGLKNAMAKMRQENNKENKDDFIKELLTARFLMPAEFDVPTPMPGVSGPVKITGQLKMYVLNTPEKQGYLMAFTDGDELAKWKKENGQKVLIWQFLQYAEVLLKEGCPHSGFVINPYGENIIIKNEFIREVMKKVRFVKQPTAPKPVQPAMVLDGTDGEEFLNLQTDFSMFPLGLAETLCEYMAGSGDVTKAYLIRDTKEDKKELLMVVETTENPKYLFPCIRNAAEPKLDGYTLNLISLDTELGKAAVEGCKPIFMKKL